MLNDIKSAAKEVQQMCKACVVLVKLAQINNGKNKSKRVKYPQTVPPIWRPKERLK